jgi:hypothetical protein
LTDEKVLEVPAFDMTDAALNSVKNTSGGKRSKTTIKRTDRRDGSVGRATFEAINKITSDGKLTKQTAFILYGERTNTKPGTVSANYYRVARADGATKPSKQRPPTARKAASSATAPPRRPRQLRRPEASTNLDAAVRGLLAGVEALAAALREEQAEAAALRQQLDGLKALL